MLRWPAVLFCILVGCKTLPSSQAQSESESQLKKELQGVEVLFWGEISHEAAQPIEFFNQYIQTLHDLGFRQMYLEVSDTAQNQLDIILNKEDIVSEDFGFDSSLARRAAWASMFNQLKTLGWSVKAIDFKARDGFKAQIASLLSIESQRLEWCQQPLTPDVIQSISNAGILETLFIRSLSDTVSFQMFSDTWNPTKKTVIYYGAAHGMKQPVFGEALDQDPMGFMGYHLAKRFGAKFKSVLALNSGFDEQIPNKLRDIFGAVGSDATLFTLNDSHTAEEKQFLGALHQTSVFPTNECKAGTLESSLSLSQYFDLVFVDGAWPSAN